MQARGHQEVARALGAGGRQDRSLELGEPLLDHPPANGRDHIGAQHDVAVKRLAPQIQIPVLEPQLLRIVRLAEHRQGQLGRLRQHLHRLDANFDLAGRQIGVHHIGVPRQHLPIHPDHALGAQPLDQAKAGRLGRQHQLRQAVMVPQIDEHQPAMVALAMNPAGQADGLARVGEAQRAAGMGAIDVHFRVVFLRVFGSAEGRIGGAGCQG